MMSWCHKYMRHVSAAVIDCRYMSACVSTSCCRQCVFTDRQCHAADVMRTISLLFAISHHYTVSQKNMPSNFCPYLCQISADFKNSFTGTLCEKFAITKLSLCVVVEYLITMLLQIFHTVKDKRLVACFFASLCSYNCPMTSWAACCGQL